MTLTELRYIVAVAKAKHFGKAAEECCVSQPTLSVGIRKLEDSLGVSIFERGRSEVRITSIGQAIINQARNVLNESQVIKDIADSEKDQLKNPIRIASTYTIGKYLFPHLIREAYSFSPRLSLLLNQDYHDILLDKLLRKELDVLLLTSDSTTDYSITPYTDLVYEEILNEDLYLLAAADNKYATIDLVNIDELSLNDLFLLNKQHCLHNQVIDLSPDWRKQLMGNNKGDHRLNEYNFDSLESLYHVVKLKSGAAIIPASFRKDVTKVDDAAVKVIPFVDPVPNRKLNLVWRNDFPRMQVVDTLKQSMRNIALPGIRAV